MGSAIGIERGADGRNKTIVTQLRQENVRLQARIEGLSEESSRLKAEINTLLKEKESKAHNDEHLHSDSPTTNATGITNEQENAMALSSFTEQVLQMELEMKQENYELARELEDLKCKDSVTECSDIAGCEKKNEAKQSTWE